MPKDLEENIKNYYCSPSISPTCYGHSLNILASGYVLENGYIWAALMNDIDLLAYGSAIPVDSGTFEGYPLTIPLSGLDLESNYMYDILIFHTSDSTLIGNPKGRRMASDNIKYSFSENEIAVVNNSYKSDLKDVPKIKNSMSEERECFVTGLPVVLKLLQDIDDSWYISAHTCTTAVDTSEKNLHWYVGGNANPSAGTISKYGIFLPLHKTLYSNDCYIKVNDTTNSDRNDSISIDILYPTDVGYSLGNSNNWIDTLVCEYADSIGFAPQLLKSQIRQESGYFDTGAYRYEPNYDYRYISYLSYKLTLPPYNNYRLEVPNENGHVSLEQGDSLDYNDAHRGESYYYVGDDNVDGYFSAWEYISYNPSHWDCSYGQCPPDTLDFTAQTAIASSYGLMQIMWPSTICCGIYWNNGNAGDPHELYNPELILTLASQKLRYIFSDIGWSGMLETYDITVDSTLYYYNLDPSYPDMVRQWLDNYQYMWSE